jgi:outer membrane biosynthesis protein TonB
MAKKFYEKGRFQYFSRNQLIDFDPQTFAAIIITFSIFIFGFVIFASLKKWTKLLNSSKTEKLEIKEKKDGDLYALSFIEPPQDSPKELKQQVKAQAITPPPEIVKDIKPEEKIPEKLPVPPKPEVKVMPKPIVADTPKKPEAAPKENKIPPSAGNGSTSVADTQSQLTVSSTSEQAETEEHIFYRKLLESMIVEKLSYYKSSFPDKWKAVSGSYIVDIDIIDGGKPTFTIITTSPNFYFNQVSDVILKGIKYPTLKNYNLKKYHQTFIFTYRPYGEE